MSLSYETHGSTGTPLLKADENLIETLEDNQVSMTFTCNQKLNNKMFSLFPRTANYCPEVNLSID